MPIEQIHPMLVHFPIVLAICALAVDLTWIVFMRRRPIVAPLFEAASILLIAAGIAAIVTAIFGDRAFDIALRRGFTDAQLVTHQTMGIATAVLLPILAAARAWIWHRKLQRWSAGAAAALATSLIAVAMVVTTAYFGGRLVYDLGVNINPAVLPDLATGGADDADRPQ